MSSDAASHRSGKLRYKRSRDDRRRERLNAEEEDALRHKKRTKKRERNSISVEGSAGPSRHPNALFGDDLLRAERYEAKMREERDWSAKLGDLLQDDFGSGGPMGSTDDAAWEEEMMCLKGSEFRGEGQQEIPKRWKDAARGFESNLGRGAAGLKEMDEEEYAEYIREGMHRRKHAKDIAFEEERQRAWDEAQAKKEKRRDEKRQAKREQREAQEKEEAEQALLLARTTWEESWLQVVSQDDGQRDLPWPVYPGPEITKESVQHFLFHETEKQEASKRLRKALLRYHPDRFFSSRHFTTMTSEKEKAAVKSSVEKVAKILSDLVNDRRTQ